MKSYYVSYTVCISYISIKLEEKKLKQILNSFIGKSIQEVPLYSSIKVNGKRLYEYARNGEEVELPKREIEIFSKILYTNYWQLSRPMLLYVYKR